MEEGSVVIAAIWKALVTWLVWLSSDASTIELEPARCAAAVATARVVIAESQDSVCESGTCAIR